ncbi:MerR family transcriptional regulator [Macrococcoides caseolyticum]|uniref:MerR family transcriptional regulator n=1 Tax=Bacilli TaxID=91061 RepID=UPI000C320E61|nr:MerR family transcriptional regulator [Macrococcus caseolyticus]PKE05943.1 MerR family transcriptional regulator [Macrococcus caseolyticus]PKE23108.1 MerR family transcriptional regulator [Macrococcus caseolyticus]PKE52240.1 MerR family transcriptional regulator [Macrococcus caseolyticus]PKF37748.1 MerR family transcriptional regulator [Macrococcus caseolyticus]
MSYTVHEVAKLSGVTIKTLYHYQKVGLLMPESVAENGYRYYGDKELKRLQQILFYRELDFSLENIKTALDNVPDRLNCLIEQYSMLKAREQRLTDILRTLEETIQHEQKGVPMSKEKMFNGLNKKEWEEAINYQNEHLQEKYGYEIDTSEINADAMNEKANEAVEFISFMAASLKNGVSVNDKSVSDAIEKHIKFMQQDMSIDANGFAAQTRFLMTDDFHRQMIEGQQTGLSYYICFAAESYAAK